MAGKFEFCVVMNWALWKYLDGLKKFCLGLELFLMALTWTSYNKILFWPKSPPSECVCLKWARIWIAPKIYLRCPEKKNGRFPICFKIISLASEASYNFAFWRNWELSKQTLKKGGKIQIFSIFENVILSKAFHVHRCSIFGKVEKWWLLVGCFCQDGSIWNK